MKKKAFTLTELLVVVVIIGVLAAVVLPRFTKVLEARRTTEAEDIMRAVRTEQEARCMLDKNYTAQKKDLASFPVNEGNNYTYAFNAVGMEAESKNKNYTLKMKSYADGGICCEGADCNSLGKNYPSCDSYKAVANIECAAEGAPEPEPEPEPDPNVCELYDHQENCPVGYTGGSRYYKVNADCTGYDVEDTCVPESNPDPEPDPDPNKCTTEGEEKYIDFVDCSTEKWKRCKNGKWEEYNKAVTSTDCRHDCGKPADETQDCEEGTTGTQTRTYTCNQSTGTWEAGEWTGECKEVCSSQAEQHCTEPQDPNGVAGTWNAQTCKCTCPEGSTLVDDECIACSAGPDEMQHCEQPQAINGVAGTWNAQTCKCTCPSPATLVGDECIMGGNTPPTCDWVYIQDYTDQQLPKSQDQCPEVTEATGPDYCTEQTDGQYNTHHVVYWTDAGGCREDYTLRKCSCN